MSKHGRTAPREWGEWREITGPDEMEVKRTVTNNLYTVIVRILVSDNDQWPDMIWLSIKRNDRRPVRDWRHLQRIKNELIGPQFEGMEMYPSEDRLVDTSNQYHLWVVDDPKFRWPWGYGDRLVLEPEVAAEAGAVQRPFQEGG